MMFSVRMRYNASIGARNMGFCKKMSLPAPPNLQKRWLFPLTAAGALGMRCIGRWSLCRRWEIIGSCSWKGTWWSFRDSIPSTIAVPRSYLANTQTLARDRELLPKKRPISVLMQLWSPKQINRLCRKYPVCSFYYPETGREVGTCVSTVTLW